MRQRVGRDRVPGALTLAAAAAPRRRVKRPAEFVTAEPAGRIGTACPGLTRAMTLWGGHASRVMRTPPSGLPAGLSTLPCATSIVLAAVDGEKS